jgi:membrane protein
MKLRVPAGIRWFWEAIQGWSRDNVPSLGASLAYYTLLAIAPVLLIAIAIASMVFEQARVREAVVRQLQDLTGDQGAQAVQGMLEALTREGGDVLALSIGTFALITASLAAFGELQHALNTIFRVKAAPAGLKRKPLRFVLEFLRDRLVSFGMVLSIGFLLLVSLVVSASLNALSGWVREHLVAAPVLWQGIEVAFSLLVVTLLFGLIYRFLPDVRLAWRDVWVGAVITAALFSIGKFLIGLYLGHSTTASRYGAAGSVVVLLLWVYYSSQVMLLGAEFTRVYVQHHGKTAQPKPFAEHDPKRHPSVAGDNQIKASV